MQKFMVPMALVLALTASGAAFGESPNGYLYEEANPFATAPAVGSQQTAGVSDPRLDPASQRASTAYPERRHWAEPDASRSNDLYHPE